ncbi:TATA-box-binding protein-like [Drosophila serrata]|uniref:TATA-box-binding protein-like n=1 Tax=Drosophila serrata TaxID=7274 RepID=UPI000A1D25FC|nr:TATA-box-binding protein-like [Drosophila serrata]XP_020808660.1 TATA-box-binding protein-like [Drosophila serrata]XP_020808661.1 TATA-box-binding protein-like [Drosophila serrata]
MERPQKMAKVNNMAPAEVQITVKQLLREAKERDLEIQAQQQQQQQVTAQKKQAAAQAQQQQKEQQQQQQQQVVQS